MVWATVNFLRIVCALSSVDYPMWIRILRVAWKPIQSVEQAPCPLPSRPSACHPIPVRVTVVISRPPTPQTTTVRLPMWPAWIRTTRLLFSPKLNSFWNRIRCIVLGLPQVIVCQTARHQQAHVNFPSTVTAREDLSNILKHPQSLQVCHVFAFSSSLFCDISVCMTKRWVNERNSANEGWPLKSKTHVFSWIKLWIQHTRACFRWWLTMCALMTCDGCKVCDHTRRNV